MSWIVISAGFAGWMHSLAPGHWLPVLLLAKTRRWGLGRAIMAAVVAASGHILVSAGLGLVVTEVQAQTLRELEPWIEKYAGLGLAVFGLLYAGYGLFHHHDCGDEHSHHGPAFEGPAFEGPESEGRSARVGRPASRRRRWGPWVFLFSLGLTPCFPVLPSFIAAVPYGRMAVLGVFGAFSLGVLTALVGATLLVRAGIARLDHPVLEHYSDVITGIGVCLMGLALFLFSGLEPHGH